MKQDAPGKKLSEEEECRIVGGQSVPTYQTTPKPKPAPADTTGTRPLLSVPTGRP